MRENNMNKEIPEFSLQRMPVYLNYLRSLPESDEYKYVSSGAIAQALGLGEVLVRKDLAYTGCAGRPKVGYPRADLISALENFLRINDSKRAVIVGAGGLGCALLSYGGFSNYGIELACAFDNDPAKTGTYVAGKPVYPIEELSQRCAECGAALAIIAVPASAAQSTAELIMAAGIKGILNFAPIQITAGENVKVINIDVAANLAILASML